MVLTLWREKCISDHSEIGLFCFHLQKNAIKTCISDQSSQKEQLSGLVTGLQVKCVCVVKKMTKKAGLMN